MRACKMYVVVQEGGTSAEHYASLYTNARDAAHTVRSHRRVAYRCTAPIPIRVRLDEESNKGWIEEGDVLELINAVAREGMR